MDGNLTWPFVHNAVLIYFNTKGETANVSSLIEPLEGCLPVGMKERDGWLKC